MSRAALKQRITSMLSSIKMVDLHKLFFLRATVKMKEAAGVVCVYVCACVVL